MHTQTCAHVGTGAISAVVCYTCGRAGLSVWTLPHVQCISSLFVTRITVNDLQSESYRDKRNQAPTQTKQVFKFNTENILWISPSD